MISAASMFNEIRRWTLGTVVALSVVGVCTAGADPFDKLPESIDRSAKELAVVFDFDTDACYPSPAVSRTGEQNGGLKPTGSITGQCRRTDQLTNSNTYYRKKCVPKEGVTYCVHMYALYFKKDQAASIFGVGVGGHRHDWEFALLWTRNGQLTHASYSTHGKVITKPKSELHFDAGKENTVKIVYHLDDPGTHSFRFAKKDETAENDLKRWITPTLVDWETMSSDHITNQVLRMKFNQFDYGDANCSFNDANFEREIAKNPPVGYPTWEKSAPTVAPPPPPPSPTPAPKPPPSIIPPEATQDNGPGDCRIAVRMRAQGGAIYSDHFVACQSAHNIFLGVENAQVSGGGGFVNRVQACNGVTQCVLTLSTPYSAGTWKATTSVVIDGADGRIEETRSF